MSKNKKKNKKCLTIGPFIDWRIYYLPKCVCRQNNEYSTINLSPEQRNFVLNKYGYASYKDYLRSELWLKIRADILINSSCACGCGSGANQVHHKIYTEANLVGASRRGLIAINGACHYDIEFFEGRKCSLGEANLRLKNKLNY